jgi:hypothetical protein
MLDRNEVVSAQVTGDGNIVIQNSDNTTITIDTTNIVELRKQISNLQMQLNTLNPEILQMLEQKVREAGTDSLPVIDANIYFSIDIITNGVGRGMGFSITITNLTKEHRYFTQPSFNLNHPYKGADSFVLTTPYGDSPTFPVRLEYGQPVTVRFLIAQRQLAFFRDVLSQDDNAAIAVVSNTTVGEIYRSNEHTLKHILDSYSKIMGR